MIALLVPPRMKTAGMGRCMEGAFWCWPENEHHLFP